MGIDMGVSVFCFSAEVCDDCHRRMIINRVEEFGEVDVFDFGYFCTGACERVLILIVVAIVEMIF